MVKNVFKTYIHIYPLSRLVNAPAASWEKLIKLIEDGKEKAFGYYLPMREAVVLYCAKDGNGFDAILAEMLNRARAMGGSRGQQIADDNEVAFRTFVENFYPKIGKYKRDLLRDAQNGIAYEGITLLGAPHFVAQDKAGRTRYVFLYAANWSPQQLKTYLQLLIHIVDKKYSGAADQIWCMDLKRRKTITFSGSTRLSARCVDAAKHYARLARIMTSE